MKLIVGLGNPGVKYRFTRHNIGFLVVDALAKEAGVKFSERRFNSRIARRRLGKSGLILLKPHTYMNLSGRAILSFLQWKKLNLEDLLVICDDVNLNYTKIRIRPGGSNGGHNGLESVIDSLGTKNFSRLRLGIGLRQEGSDEGSKESVFGKKGKDLSEYVLGQFSPEEKGLIDEFITTAATVCRVWARQGIDAAMCRFNARNQSKAEQKTRQIA